MDELITQDELANWIGFNSKRKTDIEKWLLKNHIPFLYGKGAKICTTQSAINSILIGLEPINDSEEYELK